jgi:hypothetical protein
MTVGDPEITQVDVLSESPEGSAGETTQFVMVVPPAFKLEGVTLIPIPTLPLVPEEPTKLKVGVMGSTLRATEAVPVPAELWMVTV